MAKIIFMKLYNVLFGYGYVLYKFILLFLFLGVLMIVRVLWEPATYIIFITLIMVEYILIIKYMPRKVEHKLDRVRSLINQGKFEKALENIDKIMIKNLPKAKGDKRKSIYYSCIFYKALNFYNEASTNGNKEYIKQSIELYEEVLDIALKEHKDVVDIMLKLGMAYQYLSFLENDEESLKKAIRTLETALKHDNGKKEKVSSSVHKMIGCCYQALADYCNREVYLKKSLEELDYVYDKINNGKYLYDAAVINIFRASALRKLNEINFQEAYKIKSIDNLNSSISYISSTTNIYYKKYFINQYILQQYYIGQAYFEIFKITNSEESLKNFRESIKEVKEGCIKENNAYFVMRIDEMVKDLKLNTY